MSRVTLLVSVSNCSLLSRIFHIKVRWEETRFSTCSPYENHDARVLKACKKYIFAYEISNHQRSHCRKRELMVLFCFHLCALILAARGKAELVVSFVFLVPTSKYPCSVLKIGPLSSSDITKIDHYIRKNVKIHSSAPIVLVWIRVLARLTCALLFCLNPVNALRTLSL